MKLKPNPITEKHSRRKQEIEIIFKNVPKNHFNEGLEIGAGDGFQSSYLSNFCKKLTCTEYVNQRLPEDTKNITYQHADAEQLEQHFTAKKFDVVFSSNVLEHLNDLPAFFRGLDYTTTDDMIAIHAMPNRQWKIFQLIFHHFNYALLLMEFLASGKMKELSTQLASAKASYDNPKSIQRYGTLRKILWPIPHGISKNNWQEFLYFGKKQWIRKFNLHGFEIVKIHKGPLSSGYSFGWRRLKNIGEKLGCTSEYIYIIKKKHHPTPNTQYFQ